jgi:hypothetical protein
MASSCDITVKKKLIKNSMEIFAQVVKRFSSSSFFIKKYKSVLNRQLSQRGVLPTPRGNQPQVVYLNPPRSPPQSSVDHQLQQLASVNQGSIVYSNSSSFY